MKRILSIVLILMLLTPAFAAPEIDPEKTYTAGLEHVLTLFPEDGYTVTQGAATDGVYAYIIMENQKENLCSLWKIDMSDWSVVDSAFGLALDHGNDLTYNPNTHKLIAVHNKPHYSWLSIINPDTLELEETTVISSGMCSIAYSPERDQYVIGLAGTYNFALLDSDFKYLKKFKGEDTGLTRQGMECDENYVYFPQYNRSDDTNVLVVYDWEGSLVGRIGIQDNGMEVESMFHVGEDYYLSYHGPFSSTWKMTLSAQ